MSLNEGYRFVLRLYVSGILDFGFRAQGCGLWWRSFGVKGHKESRATALHNFGPRGDTGSRLLLRLHVPL